MSNQMRTFVVCFPPCLVSGAPGELSRRAGGGQFKHPVDNADVEMIGSLSNRPIYDFKKHRRVS
jgi:hypothetical protein